MAVLIPMVPKTDTIYQDILSNGSASERPRNSLKGIFEPPYPWLIELNDGVERIPPTGSDPAELVHWLHDLDWETVPAPPHQREKLERNEGRLASIEIETVID